ncbi:MAG TPA: glycosyltransferase family 4 protein [Gaiellaceae bacterium]
MKRLLVLNQYYWPGIEATAQLLTELCEGLSPDYDVTVVAGTTSGAGPGRQVRNGVEIVRVPSTAFDRARMSLRAANYLSYLVFAALRGLAARRPDVVLTKTDPPVVGLAALLVARRFGVPLVAVVKDLFPETAVELGRLRSPAAAGAMRAAIDFYLRRADRAVAIGETMRRRLSDRGIDSVVISDWVDTSAIHPVEQERDGFVVMHSGNLGHAQDLDTLIEAAARLPEIEFRIVGSGARRAELERLATGLPNVSFHPYRPREQLSESLSAASLHFVGLASGLSGYVVPSRLYGVMAAGRPALVAADEESETAQLVRRVDCGVVVAPGRPDEVAAAIRAARDGKYDLRAMGDRGRRYVVEHADRSAGVERYRELLDGLIRT